MRCAAPCMIVCIVGFAAVAAGQDAEPTAPKQTTDQLVELLDSPNWAQREAAHRRLRNDRSISLAEIERAKAQAGEHGERRLRLMQIARSRFMTGPRAAMGVSFDNVVDGGVRIRYAVEGYDSFTVFEPGDVVLAMDGVRTPDTEVFRSLIISHDPRDSVVLTVLRGGRTVEIAMRLGHYDLLPNRAVLTDSTLHQAWLVRLGRKGLIPSQPRVVQSGLSSEQWERIAYMGEAGTANDAASLNTEPEPQIIAGGEGLGAVSLALVRSSSRTRGGSRVVVIQPRGVNADDQDRAADAREALLARELESLRTRDESLRLMQEHLSLQITAIRESLSNPNLGAAERAHLQTALRESLNHAAEIRNIRMQIEARLRQLGDSR